MSARSEPNPYESPQTPSESMIPLSGLPGFQGFLTDYRTNWLMFITVDAFYAVLLFPAALALPVGTILERLTAFGIGALVVVVCSTLVMPLYVAHFPIHLSDVGIRCLNTWSRYEFAKWKDVTSVQAKTFFFTRYFQIRAAGPRWSLWLPFFMAKPKLFWPYLLSLVEADSPLAKAICEAGLAE